MRSYKKYLWPAGAIVLWTAVLACAAYAAANFGRKDYSEYTPLERIASFTPQHLRWSIALDGGSMRWEVSARTGSFTIYMPSHFSSRRVPILSGVGDESVGTEILPGSQEEKIIQECLERAMQLEDLDYRTLRRMQNLHRIIANPPGDKVRLI